MRYDLALALRSRVARGFASVITATGWNSPLSPIDLGSRANDVVTARSTAIPYPGVGLRRSNGTSRSRRDDVGARSRDADHNIVVPSTSALATHHGQLLLSSRSAAERAVPSALLSILSQCDLFSPHILQLVQDRPFGNRLDHPLDACVASARCASSRSFSNAVDPSDDQLAKLSLLGPKAMLPIAIEIRTRPCVV